MLRAASHGLFSPAAAAARAAAADNPSAAAPTRRRLIAGLVADRVTAQSIARTDIRFTRRELREADQLGRHATRSCTSSRLAELEYLYLLLVHAAERRPGP